MAEAESESRRIRVRKRPETESLSARIPEPPFPNPRLSGPPGEPLDHPEPEHLCYTCPIHPDVEQFEPGDCPICGSTLEPKILTAALPEDEEVRKDTHYRVWLSLLLTIPTLFLTFGSHWLSPELREWADELQFLFSTPVVLWCGAPLFIQAWQSCRTGAFHRFPLHGLAALAAYLYSVVGLVYPDLFPASLSKNGSLVLFFDLASTVILIALAVTAVESRTYSKARRTIRRLLSLIPRTACLLRGVVETEVQIDYVHTDDMVRVRPGDRFPVDGTVLDGFGTVDESALTGDPLPASKGRGDMVRCGTLNQTGFFVIRATQVGNQTILSQLVELSARAQASTAPLQLLIESTARWAIPSFAGLALLALFAWLPFQPLTGVVAFFALLAGASPAACLFAAPVAITNAVLRGTQLGIAVQNATAIETLARIDTLAIDKNGTLTEGRPQLVLASATAPLRETELLQYAASVEAKSEHPLATALVEAARERGIALLPAEQFQVHPGLGVSGKIRGRSVLVGSKAFLLEREVPDFEGDASVCVAVEGQFAGSLTVKDPLKKTAIEAVTSIREMGVKTVLLTGDTEQNAAPVALELDVDLMFAGVGPEGKVEVVRSLEGQQIGMAGDIATDAGALAAADVGIALGIPRELTYAGADIVLLRADVRNVVKVLRFSRKFMRNVRSNLYLIAIYHALLLPAAVLPWGPGNLPLTLRPIAAAILSLLLAAGALGKAASLKRLRP